MNHSIRVNRNTKLIQPYFQNPCIKLNCQTITYKLLSYNLKHFIHRIIQTITYHKIEDTLVHDPRFVKLHISRILKCQLGSKQEPEHTRGKQETKKKGKVISGRNKLTSETTTRWLQEENKSPSPACPKLPTITIGQPYMLP